jgi:glucose/arabinose dehydrogenase
MTEDSAPCAKLDGEKRGRQLRASAGIVFIALVLLIQLEGATATVLPAGFVESLVAEDLASPTAIAIAPDGRIFVAEQSGRVRIIKNGVPLITPFLQVVADTAGERGMLGIALRNSQSTTSSTSTTRRWSSGHTA